MGGVGAMWDEEGWPLLRAAALVLVVVVVIEIMNRMSWYLSYCQLSDLYNGMLSYC